MQHRGQTDAGPEMLGVGGDGDQGLGGGLEQDAIDLCLVLIGDVGDRRRHGEHDVEVGRRQQLGLAGGKPLPGRCALALGAVAVAAGVVGDMSMAAVLTSRHMAAERRRAAVLDR